MLEVVFVADQVAPIRGMEKALSDLLGALNDSISVRVIALTGPSAADYPCPLETFNIKKGLGRFPKGFRRLRQSLRPLSPQETVVVPVGIWCGMLVLMAASWRRRKRWPVLLWEHSVLPWRLRHQARFRLLAAVAYQLCRRRIAGVVAVSPAVKRAVDELTRERVPCHVIPNVVELAESPSPGSMTPRGSARGPIRLLGVGGLVALKNWDLAIESLARLPNRYSLEIAGEGPERTRLQKLISERGLESRASLLGHRNDVASLLADCDAVLHPSWVETFGYSLHEAAAAMKPVVCIDMPVMNEVVPSQIPGVVCNPSAEAFARGVVEVTRRDWVPRPHALPSGDAMAVRESWLRVIELSR